MKKTLATLALLLCTLVGMAQESNDGKQLWAKSFLNQKAPELVVEKWLSPQPDTKGKFVLIDFWATWCGPCRMLAPVIEELAGEHPEVQFAKLDVDQVPDVAMRFGVSAIPTVVLFKAGKEVQRFVGVEPKGAYEQALAAL